MKIIPVCNRVIEYSFYALFFFVPLFIWGTTSELFEFNKMWLTFGLTIIIAGAWLIKSIVQGKFRIQRTPLDIPILLFLLSQIVSTIFSWDMHVSIWGYYSRFNGGLLSTLSYILLYYAFVSNFLVRGDATGRVPDSAHLDEHQGALAGGKVGAGPRAQKMVNRVLLISLFSGLIVSLWGLPSHFGVDPTCFVFRGNLDVSCWTADFQPKVRIFSTLGQPDWLAAYLAILTPIAIALMITSYKLRNINNKETLASHLKNNWQSILYLLVSILFYVDLLYTRSRSGIIAVWISVILFLAVILWNKKKEILKVPSIIILTVLFLITTLVVGQPFIEFSKINLGSMKNRVAPSSASPSATTTHIGELGGTDSGKIRKFVWQGAIETWKHYPLFGTGVETFAFAYYKYKPAGHNLTSEWNFLYNKAHNEFLNYLATTGTFGLGTYLLMLGVFLYVILRPKTEGSYEILPLRQAQGQNDTTKLLTFALLASYISILITNFFGFSVVIVNIYLFMLPAFVFPLAGMIDTKKYLSFPKTSTGAAQLSPFQWVGISLTILIGLYLLFTLFAFWNADKSYAYGYNLDRAGYYQQAYPYLQKAASERGDEPVFKEELSVNDAILAAQLLANKDPKTASEAAATASTLAQQAIATSNDVVGSSSNNVVFWKTRVRIFYTLSQVDSRFLPMALTAIRQAAQLAPNDASILYNLGVLEGQNGNLETAISILEKTVKIKPDYREPYFALGLFYHQKAVDKKGQVNKQLLDKAVSEMQYILEHLSSNDAQVKDTLKSWDML